MIGYGKALFVLGMACFAFLLPAPAEANCVMQRQCKPAYRHQQQTTYQKQCDTFWYGGRPRTTCRTRPVTRLVPVAYQDCSQVRRVCSSLGSLIGSNKKRR